MCPYGGIREDQNRGVEAVLAALQEASDPERASHNLSYFKCGPGEQGEGDSFLGVPVPEQRRIARRYRELSLQECARLMENDYHEARLTALIILTEKVKGKRVDPALQESVVSLYLSKTERINNWDLVDTSAPKILGPYVHAGEHGLLDRLAASSSLWEQRIAMITTLYSVRQGETGDALRIAEMLIDHPHDLIHKAVGWMLREVGDRDRSALERFLRAHRETMPRTALRYAIEHMSPSERAVHLNPPRGR